MEAHRNFQEYLLATQEELHRKGKPDYVSRYLVKGKVPLLVFLEHARRGGASPALIQKAEERGMLDGSIAMTYEGAQRIYDRIRDIAQARDGCKDYIHILDALDPIADHDLIATAYFCMNPSIRDQVQGKLESLYRVVLNVGAKKRQSYTLPPRRVAATDGFGFSSSLETLIRSLPREEFSGDQEYQRRLRVILEKKAEREMFPLFRRDQSRAFQQLEHKVATEKNKNLQDTYKKTLELYRGYARFVTLDVNAEFQDPETKEKGILPSLHQRIALYHLLQEKKFGIFDGCGTGKTAIAVLAQPLIAEQLHSDGKPFRRVVVVCPNTAKKAWKKGLMGRDHERYLAERLTEKDVSIINGGEKDAEFLKNLEMKKWIVVNYEQLITKVDKGDKLFVETLADIGIDYVVFDESHHIKSGRKVTKKGKPTISAAAQYLGHRAAYLALLTGSPIPDRLNDYAVPCHLLNPGICPDVSKFEELYEKNPRILFTLFNEKTVRRTSEDINEGLDWEEHDTEIVLDPVQRQVYSHIMEFRPQNWIVQARKALLDPRLVDPQILQRAGVLGQVTHANSAKYLRLEELLTSDDGPVARGEKFVVFSSMFREGVTQGEHEHLRERYQEIGISDQYTRLHLEKSLDVILKEALRKKFCRNVAVGVIDGTVTDVEERERIVDSLHDGLAGVLCTTDTGGESLDFTSATHVFFLDRDYTPKTTEQALARLLRKGQKNKVNITHLAAKDTLEEQLEEYVARKSIISRIATDGYPLTKDEWDLINDTEGKQFAEMVKRKIGGTSIDVLATNVSDVDDFEMKRRTQQRGRGSMIYIPTGETTDAQRIAKLIGQDPVNCWKDQEFVELYMRAFNTLSVPVVHRAKICDLVQRALQRQIVFPHSVLSDGSGPSILYNAYQELAPLLARNNLAVPEIVDRDISQLMLDQGRNPNKVLGCMTGKDSAFRENEFDMVDNESISLLPSPEDVRACLQESNRILKPDGLLELVVKNKKFMDGFYTGMERTGFKLLTPKNHGFSVSRDFLRQLKEEKGEHYAESYASKLDDTYVILAQRVDNPAEVKADGFWFDPILPLDIAPTQEVKQPASQLEEPEWAQQKKARRSMLRKQRKMSAHQRSRGKGGFHADPKEIISDET